MLVGTKRNVKRWIYEGAIFEALWILYILLFRAGDAVVNFLIAIAIIGWVLSMALTIIVYFEEKRLDYGIPILYSNTEMEETPICKIKVIGVERLANEHILSGEKSAKINDKKQLTLDLSFLGKLEPESAKSKKTSSTKSTSSSAKKTSSNISNKDLEKLLALPSENFI